MSEDFRLLVKRVSTMVETRGWSDETPKNLATALIVEAAELLEPFQWLDTGVEEELGDSLENISHEMSDVLIYLIALANSLEVDLLKAANNKMSLNETKFPPQKKTK